MIRQAVEADCPRIALLVERYWRFEGVQGFEQRRITHLLQAFIAQPACCRCWIVASNDSICAYLLVAYVFSLEFGGTIAEIDELYVIEEQRSSGVGSRLVQYAISEMKQAGIVHLQLQVGTANRSARAFYERLGFTTRAGYELLGRNL
jgi:ribosomal protein S18 acetylase RimI-like enzyme